MLQARELQMLTCLFPPKLSADNMAGVLEEFDEATPLRSSYCSRLTEEEYEEQTSIATERALKDLIEHLQDNPEQYRKVVKKKKRAEAEEAGLISYFKVCPLTCVMYQKRGYMTNQILENHVGHMTAWHP